MNYDKTKYIVIFRDLTEDGITIMKTDNSSLEMLEEFKYFGPLLTNQISIQEEIKCRLKSGNARGVRGLVFSGLVVLAITNSW